MIGALADAASHAGAIAAPAHVPARFNGPTAIGVVVALLVPTVILAVKLMQRRAIVHIHWLFDALNTVAVETLLVQALALFLPPTPWIEAFLEGSTVMIFFVYVYCAGLVSWFLVRSAVRDE